MTYSLTVTRRAAKPSAIRSQGSIPGIIYGGGSGPVSVAVDYNQFFKLYQNAGESTLIDCAVDGQTDSTVLIQEVQHDPVSGRIIHLDLRRIDMNKPIIATIALKFKGEAPIIKESGGTLVANISEITVQCLPKDLVNNIEVDISVLKTYDDTIRISNLALPAGMTIMGRGSDDSVAKAQAALTEEQIKAMEAAGPADLSQIELATKKEPTEEEAAAAAAGAPAPAAKKEEKEKKEEKK